MDVESVVRARRNPQAPQVSRKRGVTYMLHATCYIAGEWGIYLPISRPHAPTMDDMTAEIPAARFYRHSLLHSHAVRESGVPI